METPEFVNDPISTHVSSPKVDNYLKMNAIDIVLKTQKHNSAIKRETHKKNERLNMICKGGG